MASAAAMLSPLGFSPPGNKYGICRCQDGGQNGRLVSLINRGNGDDYAIDSHRRLGEPVTEGPR